MSPPDDDAPGGDPNARAKPPLRIEVTRGPVVECRHLVDAVVVDGDGAVIAGYGDADAVIFPRSAIKALQAVPLVETGAADAAGFSPAHLALACASHAAEPRHVAAAEAMLVGAGLDARCLLCGAQEPRRAQDRDALIRAGRPSGPIHNPCSGKHAGFLALSRHLGAAPIRYLDPDAPIQSRVATALADLTGAAHGAETRGVDGCAAPTYAIPLTALALGFARLASGRDPAPDRAAALDRIRAACLAHPEMVAGEGGACTEIMAGLGGRALVKFGAEGVFTAALPDAGLGIALKVRDGATRAAEAAIAHLLRVHLDLAVGAAPALDARAHATLRNRRGDAVGVVRVARSLS